MGLCPPETGSEQLPLPEPCIARLDTYVLALATSSVIASAQYKELKAITLPKSRSRECLPT